MRLSTFCCMLLAALTFGCNAKLQHRLASPNFESPSGVPWVESREYQVLIYQGAAGASPGKLVYVGRHTLTDKVNGKVIDPSRPKYVTNYSSGPFATATLALELHANGSLKKAELDRAGGAASTVVALNQVAGVGDEIEKKELERLERELDLEKVQDELKD